MLEGAAIALMAFATGAVFGRLWPARRRHPKIRPVKPVCGCGDHVSYHENGSGPCHATDESLTSYDKHGPVYEQIACGCQHYTGPEPLPTLYAPELTIGEGESR